MACILIDNRWGNLWSWWGFTRLFLKKSQRIGKLSRLSITAPDAQFSRDLQVGKISDIRSVSPQNSCMGKRNVGYLEREKDTDAVRIPSLTRNVYQMKNWPHPNQLNGWYERLGNRKADYRSPTHTHTHKNHKPSSANESKFTQEDAQIQNLHSFPFSHFPKISHIPVNN